MDESIPFSLEDLEQMVTDYESFTGRAKQQVEEYLDEVVYPLLARYQDQRSAIDSSLNV